LSDSPEKTARIIAALYPVWDALLQQDIIWKVQTDTYQRELERYGESTMEDSETIFWHDSQMILNYLSLKPLFESKETELLFSCLAIDSFLHAFSLTTTEKLKLLEGMQLAFKQEFNASKALRKELDKEYRELSTAIDAFVSGKAKDEFPEIFELVEIKRNSIRESVERIQENIQILLFPFLNSHIHMIINRQFTSKQRMYETVIYDYLYRYYKRIEFSSNKSEAVVGN
jgi:thiopeptide-type bacteriocin biosynthesis protein